MNERTIHSGLRRFLEIIRKTQKPLHQSDLEQIKKNSNSTFTAYFYDWRRLTVRLVKDFKLAEQEHSIVLRLYDPSPDTCTPVILFFHGGGFVLGGIKSYDHFCRRMARECGVAVVSVAYRLAPKHKFPAAHQDAWHALKWVKIYGAEHKLDTNNITVMGDSAGGNLAASVAFRARDERMFVKKQILVYPALDMSRKKPEINDQYLLVEEDLKWFAQNMLKEKDDVYDPRLSVLRQEDFSELPPTLIFQAEHDHLNAEIDAFKRVLRAADTPVEETVTIGTFHGYITLRNWYGAAHDPFQKIKRFVSG